MNKNISFSQYKEIYLSHNDESDTTNSKDNTKSGWGFYTNIEALEPIPQLINRSLTANLDINEINDSMMDYNINTETYNYKYFLKIIPICVIVFCII